MENLNSFEVMCLVFGRTLLKGGCSLTMWMNGSHLEHAMPDRGYVVGGVVDERFVKSDNAQAFKHVFLAAHREAEEMVRDGKDVVLGTWVEQREDGEYIVFDLCNLVDDMKSALELGAKRGERAIFDLEEQREIFVNHGA
jgi:hypothetical protein